MAFDGITIANLVHELPRPGGGRISKIAQPEKDELLITIKNNRENYRLQISASASLPLIYLTGKTKPAPYRPQFLHAPAQAYWERPDFVCHPAGLERIIEFTGAPG